MQRVISEFVARYREVVAAYRAQGLYPLNMPLEIRVTGLDHPRDVGVDGARRALLSALAPRADHPGWDVAVWLDILSFPGTPAANQAYRDIERFLLANYRPPYATVRPEWSKGWAYTERGAWTNQRMITRTIPHGFRGGRQSMRSGTPACAPLTGSTRTASSRAPSCVHWCASARTELPNRLQRLTASGTWVRPTPSEFPREGSWTSSGRTSERPPRPATARWSADSPAWDRLEQQIAWYDRESTQSQRWFKGAEDRPDRHRGSDPGRGRGLGAAGAARQRAAP